MAEYIEREALLEALKEFRLNETMSKHLTREDCETARNVIERAQMVIERIPAADVAPVRQWISVKDRLPKNGEYVLCWYEYFRYGDFNAMFEAYGIGYCYNGHWGGEVANGTKARVLAWMPLPEPPKGEEE